MKFASSALIFVSAVASLISAASVKAPSAAAALPTTADASATTSGNSQDMYTDIVKRLRIFADRLESNTALREDVLQASNEMANVHKSLKLPKFSAKSVVEVPKILLKMPGDALKIGNKIIEVLKNHHDDIANILKTDEEVKAEKEKSHVHRRWV